MSTRGGFAPPRGNAPLAPPPLFFKRQFSIPPPRLFLGDLTTVAAAAATAAHHGPERNLKHADRRRCSPN